LDLDAAVVYFWRAAALGTAATVLGMGWQYSVVHFAAHRGVADIRGTNQMSLLTIVIIIVIVLVLFGGYRGGGPYLMGGGVISFILLVVLILLLTGRL
jgi:hypothetical protein